MPIWRIKLGPNDERSNPPGKGQMPTMSGKISIADFKGPISTMSYVAKLGGQGACTTALRAHNVEFGEGSRVISTQYSANGVEFRSERMRYHGEVMRVSLVWSK